MDRLRRKLGPSRSDEPVTGSETRNGAAERYPCPCCGHLVFDEPPGSYGICAICFWEDDALQLRWPHSAVGANGVSLVEAQRNYASFGAMEQAFVSNVRPPNGDEPLDDGWRPVDLGIDTPDAEAAPVDGMSYFLASQDEPDPESLYYWRRKPREGGAGSEG